MSLTGIMMYFLVDFLVCLPEIRAFVHGSLQVFGLFSKIIKVNFAFLQRQNELLECVTGIYKGSIVSFRV